jgi:glycosyltransferase involved in cell wall biosynthesis
MTHFSRPRVLAVLPRIIPSTIIGVIKPLTSLHCQQRIELDLTLEYLVTRRQVANANVIVFCRNTSITPDSAFNWARELNKPIVYELDDDLLDLPIDPATPEYQTSTTRADQLRRYLASATIVRVYSEQLRQKILTLNSNVVRITGPIDWTLIPQHSAPRTSNKIRIVYATSRIEDTLADIFLDAAEHLLDRFPNRVELVFWGYHPARLAKHPAVQFRNFVTNYDRFFSQFARAGFDIGLAPLPNTDFYLSKSNNKFREYASCGIAGIYSNVSVYSDCVQDGKTGLLVANTSDDWFNAMARLVQDNELRAQIQNQARSYAQTHYQQSAFCDVWLEHINLALVQKNSASVSSATPSNQSQPSTTSPSKIFWKIPHLVMRFFSSIRSRGLGQSLVMARWTLNDLTLFRWKWFKRC